MAIQPAHFSPEELARRRQSIGASEAWDVVQARWHKLWLRKTGREPPQPDSPDAIFGRMMEGAVRERYAQLHPDREVEMCTSFAMPQHPRLTATPDALAWDHGKTNGDLPRVVEIKCPRHATGWGSEESGNIPPRVWWQIQQQMACTGTRLADVAVLRHRDVLIYRDIPRHDEAIALLVSEIEWAWQQYIAPDCEPPPDDSEQCAEHLARLYPQAPAERELLEVNDDAIADAARAYAAAKVACDNAEAIKRTCKSQILSAIGNGYGIRGQWGKATMPNVAGRKKVDHDALCIDLLMQTGETAESARAKLAELALKHTVQQPGYRRLDLHLEDTQ